MPAREVWQRPCNLSMIPAAGPMASRVNRMFSLS